MKALDVYTRAKHDLSNQLQMITSYLELEEYDKAKDSGAKWMTVIREEQKLFQLPWPNFLEAVIDHKTRSQNYSWRFEVNTSGDCVSDTFITKQFNCWMDFIHHISATGRQLIEIELYDDQDALEVCFILSGGNYTDIQGNDAFDWELSESILTAKFKINR